MQIHHLFLRPRYAIVLFLMLILGSSSKTRHPYYLSVTEIRSDSKQQTLNISCRMFTDDLQEALYKLYQCKVDLEKGETQCDASLQQYITERLRIKIDGKPVAFRFIGHETEDEATWCYLEATYSYQNEAVEVYNRLLYDFLPEQTNLVHLYRDGQRKSYKLVNPEEVARF